MEHVALTSLVRFSAYATRPEGSLSLEEGALLIAELAYPDLRHGPYRRFLDALAAEVWAELGASARLLRRDRLRQRATAVRVLEMMREVLGHRHGFTGNEDNYYDPRNSFLNETLDHQTGLPLTLGIVYLAVARRIGVPLVGVGLPAHFMVKWPLPVEEGGDLFVDVFHGARLLNEQECRSFVLRFIAAGRRAQSTQSTQSIQGTPETSHAASAFPDVSGSPDETGAQPAADDLVAADDNASAEANQVGEADEIPAYAPFAASFDPHWTEPMSARDMLTRMLNNLKMVYLFRGETAHALATVERLTILRPDLPQELRDRGLLRLAMGEPLLAAADIAAYVERVPTAPEARRLQRRIGAVDEVRARLN